MYCSAPSLSFFKIFLYQLFVFQGPLAVLNVYATFIGLSKGLDSRRIVVGIFRLDFDGGVEGAI